MMAGLHGSENSCCWVHENPPAKQVTSTVIPNSLKKQPASSFLQLPHSTRNTTAVAVAGVSATCAACKHQRKKCKPDCPLLPYFPASLPQRFAAMRRLFGVSNISKWQDTVAPQLRDRAMASMIYEAEARQRDPVHGAYGEVVRLAGRVGAAEEELKRVTTLLLHYRSLYTQYRE